MSGRDNPTPKTPDDGNGGGGLKGNQSLLIIAIAALLTFTVGGAPAFPGDRFDRL